MVMRVTVVMTMIMAMRMIVAAIMMVRPRPVAGGVMMVGTMSMVMRQQSAVPVSPPLGLKSFLDFLHLHAHALHEIGQDMVWLDLQVIGVQFDRDVAIAQVIGCTHQIECGHGWVRRHDTQHLLGCRQHHYQRTIFGHQHIAAPDHGASGQKHTQSAP